MVVLIVLTVLFIITCILMYKMTDIGEQDTCCQLLSLCLIAFLFFLLFFFINSSNSDVYQIEKSSKLTRSTEIYSTDQIEQNCDEFVLYYKASDDDFNSNEDKEYCFYEKTFHGVEKKCIGGEEYKVFINKTSDAPIIEYYDVKYDTSNIWAYIPIDNHGKAVIINIPEEATIQEIIE